MESFVPAESTHSPAGGLHGAHGPADHTLQHAARASGHGHDGALHSAPGERGVLHHPVRSRGRAPGTDLGVIPGWWAQGHKERDSWYKVLQRCHVGPRARAQTGPARRGP